MKDKEIDRSNLGNCQRCQSKRLIYINAFTRDMCTVAYEGEESQYYPPVAEEVGLIFSYDDAVVFIYCLDCGQIKGEWPAPGPSCSSCGAESGEPHMPECRRHDNSTEQQD